VKSIPRFQNGCLGISLASLRLNKQKIRAFDFWRSTYTGEFPGGSTILGGYSAVEAKKLIKIFN
jgi:hypothetical protein